MIFSQKENCCAKNVFIKIANIKKTSLITYQEDDWNSKHTPGVFDQPLKRVTLNP